MRCDEVSDLYLLSLRGKLSPEDADTLQEHVSACEACRKAFPLDKAIVLAVQSIPEAAPRENLASEICRQLFPQKEFIKFSFRHMLLLSLGLVVLFAGSALLWKDIIIKAFAYILNQTLVYFAQASGNMQYVFNLGSTATTYEQTIKALPYHLSWVFWIVFAGSLFVLISLLFSVNLYPLRKSTKHFII